ncbi:Protein CBG27357 [Caenorhabditis briggsae]|uniref:Protein CBG27357 n=1 Tax=Caenorhabditis briggsae TaxID=6238 RepID=B6IGF7_CAEBR|nr:Protein CBG27357 [Caenorhabditis briggsae]CAR98987.1 Protein CBG27357 [Caenorhabditis briggsae]
MSKLWEKLQNSFESNNQVSIDEFSEDYIEEFPILDSPETPDSIHPPGLELIENMKIIKDVLNSDKAEKNLAYKALRRFSNANDRCQASEEENKRLRNIISSLVLELRKTRVENANLNRMRLSKSHDAELWKTQADSWRTEAKNLHEIMTNRIMKKDQKIRNSRKDQGSQIELEMVRFPDRSVPETEETENSNFDYSGEVLEPVLESEDSEINEMNVQRMGNSPEFEIPAGFIDDPERFPESETLEKLANLVPKIENSNTWKTIENGRIVQAKDTIFEKAKKSRAPKKRTSKAPIVEAAPLIEESESESEDSLEVFELSKIPKTAKNARKAAKKLARLERIQLKEAKVPEVQEAPAGKRQLEVMKNLVNTKNQEIRKLRREIEKSQMIQCMDLLRIEYWQEPTPLTNISSYCGAQFQVWRNQKILTSPIGPTTFVKCLEFSLFLSFF